MEMAVWYAAHGGLDLRHHEALRTGLGADKNAGKHIAPENEAAGRPTLQAPIISKTGHILAVFSYAWGRWFNQKLQSGITERPRESRVYTRTSGLRDPPVQLQKAPSIAEYRSIPRRAALRPLLISWLHAFPMTRPLRRRTFRDQAPVQAPAPRRLRDPSAPSWNLSASVRPEIVVMPASRASRVIGHCDSVPVCFPFSPSRSGTASTL